MGHVVRETAWRTIDIDTRMGRVFLQERWQYIWKVQPGLAAWTSDEKRDFHQRADRSIWAAWSNRASLGVVGKSDFAKRFSRRRIPINLDIRWAVAKPHLDRYRDQDPCRSVQEEQSRVDEPHGFPGYKRLQNPIDLHGNTEGLYHPGACST